MPTPEELEVEVAIVRGKDCLSRAVLRPPEGLTVGSSDQAMIRLEDPSVPHLLPVVEFRDSRPILLFREDAHIEVDADGDRLDSASLLVLGMAERGDGLLGMAMGPGVRAVLRVGPLRLLLKSRQAIGVSVWNRATGSATECGGCGAALGIPLVAAGVLIPCDGCGDLTRFEASDAEAASSEPASSGAVSSGGPTGLPTYDAISRLKAEQGLATAAAVKQMELDSEASGPARDAFDDDEEATELETAPPQLEELVKAVEETPADETSKTERVSIEKGFDGEDEEAPTDPGRAVSVALSEGLQPAEPAQDEPGPEADRGKKGYALESAPQLPRMATGADFLVPRRRRRKPKPNRLGWALLFVGLISALAGLALLLASVFKMAT